MPHATNAEKSRICVWTVAGLWFTRQIPLALLLATMVIYIHVAVMCWRRLNSQGWKKWQTLKHSQRHFNGPDLDSIRNYSFLKYQNHPDTDISFHWDKYGFKGLRFQNEDRCQMSSVGFTASILALRPSPFLIFWANSGREDEDGDGSSISQ